jgi:hypothetical protein
LLIFFAVVPDKCLDITLNWNGFRNEAGVALFEALRWDLSAVTDKNRERTGTVCQINHTYSA